MFALAVLLLCLGQQVLSKSYGFVYPNATDSNDESLAFLLGEEIDIQWSSPFQAIKLAFIADDGPVFQFFSQNNTGSDYSWAVNVNNSGSTTPYYYLYFENEHNNSEHYYSAQFRVDSPVNAQSSASQSSSHQSTTTVIPSPSLQASASLNGGTTVFVTQPITLTPIASSASGIPISTIGTFATGASSPTGSVVPATNSGLSQGAKIGIGIGVPLGIIALIGIGILAVWRRRRQSNGGNQTNPADASDLGMQEPSGAHNGYGGPGGAPQGYQGQQPSAYAQHANKLASNQHAYTPVKQQIPPAESGGLHELPNPGVDAEPHEMEGSATGFRGYR